MKIYHILFVLFLASIFTHLYFEISFLLFIILLYSFINNIGKKILFIESITLYSCVIYLIVPVLGYTEYTFSNPLAIYWKLFMQVSMRDYYSYALPAILIFSMALYLFNTKSYLDLTNILKSARLSLYSKYHIALRLILIGFIAFYVVNWSPASFKYPLTIIYLSSFAGLLYIYFNNNLTFRNRYLIILIFGIWLLKTSISQGMFTIIIYMGISVFGILMLGCKITFTRKAIMISILLFGTLTLQYTKANYRSLIKKELISDTNILTFFKIYLSNLKHIDDAFDYNSFFPIYARVNQGYQLARVMDYMPSNKPYDNGARLGTSILASIVPRLFWQNKPIAGGKANMLYYADVFLDTTSMNVGPIGEGYGSFGRWGGILYMLFFGSVIGWSFSFFINLCGKYPLLLFWQPMIFYEVIYCMENDTMQAFNSLIKTSILLYLIFKVFPLIINNNGSGKVG